MNAIERLRHAADVHLSGLTVQRREQIAADLAAVVALYQATDVPMFLECITDPRCGDCPGCRLLEARFRVAGGTA